ncbi:glycoside hydrolase family 97 catalytic domain-containing protein [Maribellus mangrovi]|uniref:glycoside hydrolase family 97 catalytic domain-containing protein n=1 Tax=Maribellus mangrovi TaxID=3133146 RepID=UPI0030EE5B99
MNRKTLLTLMIILVTLTTIYAQDEYNISSPDGAVSVDVTISTDKHITYSVSHSGTLVLEPSKLGVVRKDVDLSKELVLDSVSDVTAVNDQYTLLHGKRHECVYQGNKKVFHLSGANNTKMDIIFQVSNDGVAFRYYFPNESESKIEISKETSSFNFLSTAKAFIQPAMDSKSGWNQTQPSYEEQYWRDINVGTAAPFTAGWVMPALFKSGNIWVSLTETAVDGNYCGSRLSRYSPGGEYSIQFPQSTEGANGGAVYPESNSSWYTPWRIIALSDNLGTLVESTLGTDLATPEKYDVSSWLEPGKASWSWIMLGDGSINYNVQKQYIDFAASMNWQYCLVDVNWDVNIGYSRIEELANYAATKNVKLILWYNSAGNWNTVTFYTPRNKMLTHESRVAEFAKLQEMGIAGIKVDFFPGDGQSSMKYYTDILKDAADYEIAVNFHGCTFPRGWARTYPNLMTMESIKGEEYITFNQADADAQPAHCTTIPFTRNLFDPMDFTPVNFSGISNISRKTTKGFEAALSVIFTSGIQHFAESVNGMAQQRDFLQEYMRNIPDTWDDVKFIEGDPGKLVVMARKAGDRWYIAGINGEPKEKTINLDLAFLNDTTKGIIYTDSIKTYRIIKRGVDFSEPFDVKLYPYGGFVIKTILDSSEIDTMAYAIDTLVVDNSVALDSGLVGYFPFDEGEGATTENIAEGDNVAPDGDLQNNPGWVDGKFGKALNFSSTSSNHVTIGTFDPTQGGQAMSISAWIRWGGTGSGGWHGLCGKRNGWTGVPFMWDIATIDNNGIFQFEVNTAEGKKTMNTTQPPATNDWTHVVLTFDGEFATFYYDGEIESQGPMAYGNGRNATFTIGCAERGGNYAFNGIIDEFRIYNRVLNSKEVSELFLYDPGLINSIDDQVIDSKKAMHIYPNPVSTEAIVSYTIDKPGLVNISLYDITGKVVRELINEHVKSTENTVVLDRANLSSGIFLSVLKVDSKIIATEKMILR